MRPVPFVYLPTTDDWIAFWRIAFAHGYSWDGITNIDYAIKRAKVNTSAFAQRSKMIWVGAHPLRKPGSTCLWSSKPFVQMNSAVQLLSYMRETDRLKETHA